MDSNRHGNVVVVVPRKAPRAPMVKAPDFEKPLRGDKSPSAQSTNEKTKSAPHDFCEVNLNLGSLE